MIDATNLDALVQAIAQAIGSQLASSSSGQGAGQRAGQGTAPAVSATTTISRLGDGGLVGALPTTTSSPVASSPVASSPVASSPVASGPVASSPVASSPVASGPAPSLAPSPAAKPEPAAWRLDQRLITQATLQGRLAGIRQLIVPSKAVVTPTALDLLRKQGIELQRDSNSEASPVGDTPSSLIASGRGGTFSRAGTVGSSGSGTASSRTSRAGSASPMLGTLYVHGDDPAVSQRSWQSIWPRDRWLVESLVACPLPQAIAELAAVLSGSGRLGILLSTEPDAAVWLANRQTTLRATMAGSVDAVRAAVQSIGANLLIIAPQRTPAYSSRAIVRQFLADGPRVCPQRWASVDKQTVGALPRGGT